MIASHPDVVIAWNKLMRAIWGSLFISLFVAVPIAVWFVDFSKRRGKSILEERHQRGAMLVDGPELAAVINAHNRDMLDRRSPIGCPARRSGKSSPCRLSSARRRASTTPIRWPMCPSPGAPNRPTRS
jgi:hypothetical protein